MISLVCSRFSVRSGSTHLGVVVPRTEGWTFVPFAQRTDDQFICFYGDTPQEAVYAAGFDVCVIEEVT